MREALKLAERVLAAERSGRAIAKLTDELPAMTLEDGYAVQDEIRRLVLAEGDRLAGFKAGLTSRAKMKQMGVDLPTVGFLTRESGRTDGASIPVAGLIHPRVEAEVAFVMKAPLRGSGCNAGRVLEATDCVLAAVEVIDSRYENFRFDLQSVIADNNSAALYVAGAERRDPRTLDLAALGVVLEKNGEVVAQRRLVRRPRSPRERGRDDREPPRRARRAGSFVISGGITEAIAVAVGDPVTARIIGLGAVAMRFV